MPNPPHIITSTLAHPRKRVLTALAAALLAAGGLWAYSAQHAPPAHAASQVTALLDVSVNPGSVTVGLATVTATVTYTCTVSTPDGQAQLRVDFDQSGNDTSGETGVPCGAGDISKTQTITAVQVGMNDTQDVSAAANLDDGATAVYTITDDLAGVQSLHIDPTATFPGNGTVTLTGSYNCHDISDMALVFNVSQNNGHGVVPVGIATIGPACDGTNHGFSITVSSANQFTFGDTGHALSVMADSEGAVGRILGGTPTLDLTLVSF